MPVSEETQQLLAEYRFFEARFRSAFIGWQEPFLIVSPFRLVVQRWLEQQRYKSLISDFIFIERTLEEVIDVDYGGTPLILMIAPGERSEFKSLSSLIRRMYIERLAGLV